MEGVGSLGLLTFLSLEKIKRQLGTTTPMQRSYSRKNLNLQLIETRRSIQASMKALNFLGLSFMENGNSQSKKNQKVSKIKYKAIIVNLMGWIRRWLRMIKIRY